MSAEDSIAARTLKLFRAHSQPSFHSKPGGEAGDTTNLKSQIHPDEKQTYHTDADQSDADEVDSNISKNVSQLNTRSEEEEKEEWGSNMMTSTPICTAITNNEGMKANSSPVTPSVASLHYESLHVPKLINRGWTIRDFPNVSRHAKMLKAYKLEMADFEPPIEFQIEVNRYGVLVLQPFVRKSDIKKFSPLFVKYGFSLGPHATLHEDFTIDSPILQLKKINKSNLGILEMNRIIPTYLVDGNLNLVVRFTSYLPQTQPVLGSPAQKMAESSGDCTIQNCSSLSLLVPPKEPEDVDGTSANGSTPRRRHLSLGSASPPPSPSRGRQLLPMFSPRYGYGCDDGGSTDSSSSCILPIPRNRVRSKPLRKSKKQEFLSMKKDAQRTSLNYED